jgi:hypothetical protein
MPLDENRKIGHYGRMAQIINFQKFKQFNTVPEGYREAIKKMDKMDLLKLMVEFQEERSRIGYLTDSLIARGRVLFRALEDTCETQELRMLVQSYRRHLEVEETIRRIPANKG